ncbi:hypothetical protein [Burkholderia alba]|uniref:hypothetical protein n=1 Tax=Burkholderia alba TaxID=2683677 RepID=UPI002B057810|nr:hypothetical protein [Burkholderia alba]
MKSPSLLAPPASPRPRWLAAALVCAALAACGGDDSAPSAGSGKPATPPVGSDDPSAKPGEPGQPPATTPSLRCAP